MRKYCIDLLTEVYLGDGCFLLSLVGVCLVGSLVVDQMGFLGGLEFFWFVFNRAVSIVYEDVFGN